MSNQSLFGWSAGALMKVRRSTPATTDSNPGDTSRSTIEVRFDNDVRTNDVSYLSESYRASSVSVPNLNICPPGVWSSNGSWYGASIIFGPSAALHGDRLGVGKKHGKHSIDITTGRTSIGKVPTDYGICIGYNNQASTYGVSIGTTCYALNSSVAIGDIVNATGSYSVAIGPSTSAGNNYTVAIGNGATGGADRSVSIGNSSNGNSVCRHARATGDAKIQSYEHCLKRQTTDATPAVLTTDASTAGTSNQNVLANNSCQTFWGMVEAFTSDSASMASWIIQGKIRRTANAASTVLVDSTVTAVGTPDTALSTATVTLSADTTNGGLAVTATGVAATTINWGCVMYSSLRAT